MFPTSSTREDISRNLRLIANGSFVPLFQGERDVGDGISRWTDAGGWYIVSETTEGASTSAVGQERSGFVRHVALVLYVSEVLSAVVKGEKMLRNDDVLGTV